MTEQQLQVLVQELSVEEKAFQLTQAPAPYFMEALRIPGTEVTAELTEQELSMMGSVLYVCGAKETREIQERCMAANSHGIPMMFMMDVIHGYRTIFPIPLGIGASFDEDRAEDMMRVAAAEASAAGIQVAFSPMLDLVRDPRWGRVMESTGEDPYLNSILAPAMVRGLQGKDPVRIPHGRLSSCIKHYAAYGAPEGGREYQNVELSEHTLREYYLPAYRAAVEAGADLVMTSFQTLNGIPSAANRWLLKDILRGEWGFEGVVITDWSAIEELVIHGVCADLKDASLCAFQAGVDIDMCSMAYYRYLPELVREGKIKESDLDQALLRVLRLKNKLGLFENPFKDASEAQAKIVTLCPEHRDAARKAVRESLVLLKNEGEKPLLPLSAGEKISLIGPYLPCRELLSDWAFTGDPKDVVSIQQAAEELPGYSFTYAAGCRMTTRADFLEQSRENSIPKLRKSMVSDEMPEDSDPLIEEAVRNAREAACAVLFLGEHYSLSGEGASRANITLPYDQLALLRAISKVNRNIVTVVCSGRPLDLQEVCRISRAVVMAWLPGTEGGHGIMEVLTGKENFSGKLPMSIPVSVGQIPVFYNHLRTGRPKDPVKDDPTYRSAYIDTPNRPLFPFGYGLSYSSFSLSPVSLSTSVINGRFDPEDRETVLLTASAEVCNGSDRAGTLTVQLYVRDDTASLARPVRELKSFRRVALVPGEKRTVCFAITPSMLSFHGADGKRVLEPGSFKLWIGEDSETENEASFVLR